jgi:hypothetical protein
VTVTDILSVKRRDEKASDHGLSSRSWGLEVGVADFTLSWLPRKVERTKMVLSQMNPLLLMLWRERHPKGQEQVMLDFASREKPAESAKAFSRLT